MHLTPKFFFRLRTSSCFDEYFFEKIFGFGQIHNFLCPVEVEYRMDHDRVNGDLGRVELRRHFEKTLKQFSVSRQSAKAFPARKFILFSLHSLCNSRKNYYVFRIIGLGDDLRLRRLGIQRGIKMQGFDQIQKFFRQNTHQSMKIFFGEKKI